MKYFVGIAAYFCLFSFKFNIIPYADTGIRLDDLLLAIFGGMTLLWLGSRKNLSVPMPLVWVTLLTVWSVLSVLINVKLSGISLLSGLLFAVRPLEYAAAFYMGLKFCRCGFNFDKYIMLYVSYAFVLSFLMAQGWISGLSKFDPNRYFANTNGPYELAPLMAFCVFYFIDLYRVKSAISALGFAAISGLSLLLTVSRITVFGALVALIYSFVRRLTSYRSIAKLFLLIPVLIIGFILLKSTPAFEAIEDRMSSAVSHDTIASTTELYHKSYAVDTQSEYLKAGYSTDSFAAIAAMPGDVSFLLRVNRWFFIVKSIVASKVAQVIGFGPSFASVAVDGQYFRILIEVGIVGLLIFFCLILSIWRYASSVQSTVLKEYLLMLFVTGCFIDIFVSYKVMFLLWFYLGYLYESKFEDEAVDNNRQSVQTDQ